MKVHYCQEIKEDKKTGAKQAIPLCNCKLPEKDRISLYEDQTTCEDCKEKIEQSKVK